MILSVSLNVTMLFAFVICLTYTLGDFELVRNTPTALPIVDVYHQTTKNKHATNFLVFGLEFIQIFARFNAIASVSRLIWSLQLTVVFLSQNTLPM